MPHFRDWLRKALPSTQKRKTSLSKPPVLPDSRPRALSINEPSNATRYSPFFRLPLEIRQVVYKKLFSNRDYHIELEFCHPDRQGTLHAGLDYPHQDDRKAKEWLWWSSVCHRTPELEFWEDGCRRGTHHACVCTKERGEGGDDCFVQGFQWLLTCRQAYMEAIPYLYNNKFIFACRNPSTFWDLHKYILPKRLANVTGIELTLWLHLESKDHAKKSLEEYWAIFEHLDFYYPSIKSLDLALDDEGFNQISDFEEVVPASSKKMRCLNSHEIAFLSPMDAWVARKGPSLTHVQLAIECRVLCILHSAMYRQMGESMKIQAVEKCGVETVRAWRVVGDPSEGIGYWVTGLPLHLLEVCGAF